MQTYETVFIARPTLTDDEERATVDGLSRVITEGGGELFATDRLGRRRLAYPIHKHQDGVYVRFLYDAAVTVPKELERRMRLSDSVLRALTIRLERDWAVAAKDQAARDETARLEGPPFGSDQDDQGADDRDDQRGRSGDRGEDDGALEGEND